MGEKINFIVAYKKTLPTKEEFSFTTTTSEGKFFFDVEPYVIAPSKEEQCNYLLCRDRRKSLSF